MLIVVQSMMSLDEVELVKLLTQEEFLRGVREDHSVIDVLSLYQRDDIAQ